MCLASFLLFLPTSYHYFKLIRNFLFKFKMLVLTWFVNIRIFMELKMCLAQVYKTTVSAVVSNTVPLLYQTGLVVKLVFDEPLQTRYLYGLITLHKFRAYHISVICQQMNFTCTSVGNTGTATASISGGKFYHSQRCCMCMCNLFLQ